MSSEPTQPRTLHELTRSVAGQLAAGESVEGVVQQLVARGWPEVSAREFVVNASQSTSMARASAGESRAVKLHNRQRIGRGALLILGGAAISALGLSLPDASASLFLFAVGILLAVFGTLDFLFGLSGQ